MNYHIIVLNKINFINFVFVNLILQIFPKLTCNAEGLNLIGSRFYSCKDDISVGHYDASDPECSGITNNSREERDKIIFAFNLSFILSPNYPYL